MSDISYGYIAFAGHERIAQGALDEVVLATKRRAEAGEQRRIAVYDSASGQALDLDLRGSEEQVLARLAEHPLLGDRGEPEPPRRGPGRPRLGVVSREVSLLPRHWDWLAEQRGGASATLRRLIDEARRREPDRQQLRQAQQATHRFMWDLAGDLEGFEEASRALYAGDAARFAAQIAAWPVDLRDHLQQLYARQRALEALAPGAAG